MNKLSNKLLISDDKLAAKNTNSSKSMLVTMMLLIAGFVMTSALLLNHAHQQRSQNPELAMNGSGTDDEKGSLFSFLQMFSSGSEGEKEPAEDRIQFDAIRNLVVMQGDKIRWPRLTLTGFGTSIYEEECFAIINGNKVHPGEYAGKVKLIEVREDGAVVEYLGERKILVVPADE